MQAQPESWRFPPEVWYAILLHIGAADVIRVSETCRDLRSIVRYDSAFLVRYAKLYYPIAWKRQTSLTPPDDMCRTLYYVIVQYVLRERFFTHLFDTYLPLLNIAGKRSRATDMIEMRQCSEMRLFASSAMQCVFGRSGVACPPDLFLSLLRKYRIYVRAHASAPPTITLLERHALEHHHEIVSLILDPKTRYMNPSGIIMPSYENLRHDLSDEKIFMYYLMNPTEDFDGFMDIVHRIGSASLHWMVEWPFDGPFPVEKTRLQYDMVKRGQNRLYTLPIHFAVARGHIECVRWIYHDDKKTPKTAAFQRGVSECSHTEDWLCPTNHLLIAFCEAQPKMARFLHEELGIPWRCPHIESHSVYSIIVPWLSAIHYYHGRCTNGVHDIAAHGRTFTELHASALEVFDMILGDASQQDMNPKFWYNLMTKSFQESDAGISESFFKACPVYPPCCESEGTRVLVKWLGTSRAERSIAIWRLAQKYRKATAPCAACVESSLRTTTAYRKLPSGTADARLLEFHHLFTGEYDVVRTLSP